MHLLVLLASSLLPVLTLASPAARGSDTIDTFNPLAFPLHRAICPGINRAENNKTVDLHLRMFLTMAFSCPLILFLLDRIC